MEWFGNKFPQLHKAGGTLTDTFERHESENQNLNEKQFNEKMFKM